MVPSPSFSGGIGDSPLVGGETGVHELPAKTLGPLMVMVRSSCVFRPFRFRGQRSEGSKSAQKSREDP